MLPFGFVINSLEVPNSSERGITAASDQMVTSFSSKSELALNLSNDGRYVTFMGYVAPIDAIDLSNANSPGAVDPTNPVGENIVRAVAQVDRYGKFQFTETNAYSGNNGRAAILNHSHGSSLICTAGNARQRGERQQSSAGGHYPWRRNPDPQPGECARERAESGHAHAGRQFQHNATWVYGRQDRQG